MEKPMSQRMHEKVFGGSPLSTGLDAALVAQSFGVALPVGESLHESDSHIAHVEDLRESPLLIDGIASPKAKPARKSLFEIVTSRLRSIKPRTKERAKQVAQALSDLQEPLMALDELIATLEAERFEDLQKTWDELQSQGRDLRRRIENEFTAVVNSSMMAWNDAEANKVRAKTMLETRIGERRALRLDRYSTKQQLADADLKVQTAVGALNAAKALHLEAERNKMEAENAKRLASGKLRAIEIAMDRCGAEISGVQYHDPATGLAIDPTANLAQ